MSTPPSIVFIFTDDLGYGDLGIFGAGDINTPNIDSIGHEGVVLTDFYSASPICTPSRAALLTGRYPVRMGIHEVFFPHSYAGMPPDEITVAELLREVGYRTAVVGKWHLGHHEKFLPLNQGFDEFFGIPYSNDMPPLPLMRDNQYIEHKFDQDTLTERLTDYAIEFIDANADRPFFLYVPYPMPHYPLHRSDDFREVSARGDYGDVIEEIDFSVGRILKQLRDREIRDNTLVVFTSDNGPWLVMGDEGGSAGSLRNGKGTTFEGGVRVPAVARFPGEYARNLKIASPLSMMDWFPTLVELGGANVPDGTHIDGQSMLPMLASDGEVNSDRSLYFYSHGKIEAIRQGKWKYKRPFSNLNNPIPKIIRPILGGEFNLAEHGALLFDLSVDPGETINLIDSYLEIGAKLETQIKDFEDNLGLQPDNITPLSIETNASLLKILSKLGIAMVSAVLLLLVLLLYFAYRLGRRIQRRQ
ncbi:MAG: sulfatase [Pseudomonadota bacterium]